MTWSGFSESGQGSQERGPGTFSLRLPGMPTARAAPGAGDGPMRVGIEGGNVTVGGSNANNPSNVRVNYQDLTIPNAVPKADPALQALQKVGGKIAQKAIDTAVQEQFVAGAARAASGEAMIEIANDQPWYANVFGDTAVVEGARAYSVKERVATWSAAHISNMAQLAEMPPSSLPGYLNTAIKGVLTGDPATDQALSAELMAQIPVLVKEQTKQHVMLTQKRADDARGKAFDATFGKYGLLMSGQLDMTAKDVEVVRSEVQSMLVPPQGVNIDRHWEQATERAVLSISQGNTHLYNLLATDGLLERLPVEDQAKIGMALERAAPKALAAFRARPEILKRDLDLDAAPKTREQYAEELEELQFLGESFTGIPRELARAFPEHEVRSRLRGNDADLARSQSAAMQAAEAVGNEQRYNDRLSTYNPAALQSFESNSTMSDKEREAAVGRRLATMDPTQRVDFINKWGLAGRRFDAAQAFIDGEFAALMTPGTEPGRALAFFQVFEKLDDSVRSSYFKDNARDVAAIASAYRATGNFEAAQQSRVLHRRMLDDQIKAVEGDTKGSVGNAVRKLVEDRYTSTMLGRIFTGAQPDLSPTQLRYIEGAVMREDRTGGSIAVDPSQRAASALAAVINRGDISVASGMPIFKLDTADTRQLHDPDYVRGAGHEIDMLLGVEINKAAAANGIEIGNSVVTRMPGKRGQPILYQIVGWDENNTERYAYVTSNDVEKAKVAADAQANALRDPQKYRVGVKAESIRQVGTPFDTGSSEAAQASQARAAAAAAIRQRMD